MLPSLRANLCCLFRFSYALVFCCLCLIPAMAFAQPSGGKYEVRSGDFNGDGRTDLFLKWKPQIILIHGDIITPIVVPGPVADFLLTKNADGTYNGVFSLTQAQKNTLSQWPLTSIEVLVADVDNNGFLDISLDVEGNTIRVWGNSNGSGGVTYTVTLETTPMPVTPGFTQVPSNSTIINSDQVGATAGQFRVDESGSATYSIPILSAAGTAGVAPQISLNYSSQGGNGLLGKGWSIGGLSAITRCRQTLQVDRVARPLVWGPEDRFCLDGQRLLVISGTYGAHGAIYKTEIDSFAKIVSHGPTTGHPDGFSVERKDGSVSFYGFASDARQSTAGGALTWAIKQFNDSVGNPIVFSYADGGAGHRISSIGYAYNQVVSNAGYYPPTNYAGASLKFEYKSTARPDPIKGYVAGHLVSLTTLLERVRSIEGVVESNQDIELRRYELSYAPEPGSTQNKASKLTSIQECRDLVCTPATNFNWPAVFTPSIGAAVSSFTIGESNKDHLSDYRPADINGDGIMDLVWLQTFACSSGKCEQPSLYYAFSNGTQLQQQSFGGGATHVPYSGAERAVLEVLDYNADGRQDVLVWTDDFAAWRLYLSVPQPDGTWKLTYQPGVSFPFSSSKISVGDFNADGLVDVLSGNTVYYLERDQISQPDSSPLPYHFVAQPIPLPPVETEWWGGQGIEQAAGDFNGDGVGDFLHAIGYFDYTGSETGVAYIYYSLLVSKPTTTGEQAYEQYWPLMLQFSFDENTWGTTPWSAKKYMRFADINGDGLTDLLYFYGGHWRLLLSNGVSFVDKGPVVPASSFEIAGKQNVQLIDYNGDGYLDVIWHDTATNYLRVQYWQPGAEQFTGPVFIAGNDGSLQAPYNDNRQHIFLDLTGDGALDYIDQENKTFRFHINQSSGPRDMVTKITSGLGAETDIIFEPLSRTVNYSRVVPGVSQTQICFDHPYAPGGQACFPVGQNDYRYYNDPFHDLTSIDQSLYPEDTAPVLELNGPLYVVTRVASSAPTAANVNAKSAISYFYGEGKIQAAGRGFLGFKRLMTVDEQTGIKTSTTYRQDFPFIGHPLKTEVRKADGISVISQSTNTWGLVDCYNGTLPDSTCVNNKANLLKTQGSKAIGPIKLFLARSEESTYSTSSGPGSSDVSVSTVELQKVTTQSSYDLYGNPTSISVTTQGGGLTHTKVTTNQYSPGNLNPIYALEKGRLSRTEVTTTRNGASLPARVSEFSYYNSGVHHGLLQSEVIEPDRLEFKLTTNYLYDGFGNQTKATQIGGTSFRVTEMVYDPTHRYVDQTKNGFGQIVSKVIYRNEYGAPTEIEDINGVKTRIGYTPFGREFFRSSQTGAWSQTLPYACSACDGVTHARYKVVSTQAGGGQGTQYFDRLGRSVRKVTQDFAGGPVYQLSEYDSLGRVTRVSEPSASANPSYWTANSYDILGRVVQSTAPDGGVSKIFYNGLTTTYRNATNQDKIETKNVLGELVEVEDNLGGKIYYGYDPHGNMTSMQAVASGRSILTTIEYDLLGRKKNMNDPDKGIWRYNYNNFGELTAQLNAKLQCSVMSYDDLGRMISRQDKLSGSHSNGVINCNGAVEANSQWVYNNNLSGAALGQLQEVKDLSSGYVKAVLYDSFGRPKETVTNLGGSDGMHFEKVTYDQYGRTFQVFDAAREGNDYSNNGIEYRYNQYGYLYELVDAVYENGDTRRKYQKIQGMDARGNVTNELLGNGYTTTHSFDAVTGRPLTSEAKLLTHSLYYYQTSWDQLGNLLSRHKKRYNTGGTLIANKTETFSYDGLNRLATASGGGQSLTMQYDGLGNIINKTGVGGYTYGSDTLRPHAAASAGGVNYTYDANGNLTSDTSGRTIQYTSYDLPKLITKGAHNITFKYGPDRARYKRVDANGSGTTTTLYVGSVEKITKPNGTKEVKRYIGGVAIITESYSGAGAFTGKTEQYLYKDHLGSILMITGLSDGTNPVVVAQDMDFDAWGQRRGALDWSVLSPSLLANFDHSNTTRGFTGHEMLDEVGLIHMNGRIYDPRLGRFVQADPFVQAPSDLQMLNRYSYVRNNPLNMTDPSGYIIPVLMGAVAAYAGASAVTVGVLVGVATFAQALYHGASLAQALARGVGAGVAAGAFSALEGVGFQAISIGGVTISAGVAKAVSFGMFGGMTSVLHGGKFGHGFISAGAGGLIGGPIAGALGPVFRNAAPFVTQVVVGGTVSELTGGKFKNGAATAAFMWALRAGAEAVREPTAEEVTYGKLAEGVYDPEFEGADGYTRVKNHTDNKTGLQAALFVNQDKGHHVLAFAGTDPSSWANWKANLRQAFGFRSAQYEQGIDLAIGYHEGTGGNIHFTGHSLGGGIASASAIVTGGSATVFNAAGVHTNTLRDFAPSNGSVNYIYSSFDVLRLGNMVTPARVPGERIPLGGAGLHGMRGVCREMGC